MDKISKRIPYNKIEVPNLPALNIKEIWELKKKMSNEKAIGVDGVSDKAIRKCKKY